MSQRIKSVLFTIAALLAIFIPTYIAIANYAIVGSWQNTLTGDQTALTIKDSEGSTVFNGKAGEETTLALAKSLAQMMENGTALRTAPTMDEADVYTVTAEISGKTREYLCYYSAAGESSYLFDDEANVCYEIKSEEMLPFLQGFFYGETHETLSVPTLIAAGNEIVPYYISWLHKNEQGGYIPITNLATASEEATYPVNKTLPLRFTTEPDVATVEITNGSDVVYHGDYESFTGMSFDGSAQLTIIIEAKWIQSSERDYYGEAKYHFYVNYSAQPAFVISADKATVGDYIAISVLNASSPEDITLTSTPDLGITPAFYEDGDYVRALIPFRTDLSGGVYQITVSTKGAEETFEITLEERSTLSRPYDAGTELINQAHSPAALSEYEQLRQEIGNTRSTTKYFNGKFIDYRESSSIGAILMLGYAHTRTLITGDTYRMDGVDFIIYQGTEVPALNSGMVIATGQTAYLGNYVIVDHGLGLRTWYCHLSEISVSVGDTVTSAQAVGKSGSTGFTTGSGVYLICTIGETPISPDTLWSDGVVY